MLLLLGAVLVEHLVEEAAPEDASVEEALVEQGRTGGFVGLLAHQLRDRHAKSDLGPVHAFVRHEGLERRLEQRLALVVEDLLVARDTRHPFDELVVQEGRARLEAMGHRGYVHFHQEIPRQVGLKVDAAGLVFRRDAFHDMRCEPVV